MSYIVFKNHPSDLIHSLYKKNRLESFLTIGSRQIQIPTTKISFQKGNIFKIYCKFPIDEVEREYVFSTLMKMRYENEIIEFKP